MTEYNILNKPGRKKMMLFFGLVFLTAIAFFYINSARMDDFTSLITDTTVQYQNNGVMKDYTADVHLEDNTPLSFLIKATVPQGTLASIENVESEEETTQETVVKNQTLTYNLPEQLKVEDTQTNKLYLENDLVHSIGTYEIRNNLLTMYFDEDHVNTNAESELKLALVLETDSSHVIYDVNGSSLVSFNTKNIELNKYIEQPTETTVTNQVDEQVVEEVVTASNYTNNAVAADVQNNEEEIQTGNIETTDKSVDFGNHLTGATVMKNVNGHWQKVENNTFTDGDQVQVSLSYQLPPNTVDKNNKVIYYQLPDGVRPIEEQSGEVKQHGKVVGHYVINTEGKILIEFNDDFADGEAFTGDIQFEGTISKTGDGDQDEINFGNDTEKIIVTKKKDNYDLDLKKKATLSEDKSKINYQIVASTTNGTGESLKITDSFVSNTNATGTYDKSSMKLYKVSADGTKTEVTDKTPTINTTNGQQTFTYDNLDKLEKGEQYIVEYSANVEESKTKTDGSSKVQNNAYASNKYVNRWAGTTTEISKTMISKEGWYDQSTGLIKWQIKVNAGKQDIGSYTLKDTLPEGIDFSGNIVITDSSGKTVTTIDPTDKNINYTFSNGSKDSYTVTYYTTAPNGNGNVSNTSTIGKGDMEYTSTGVVGVIHRTWSVNKSWKNETVSTKGQRKYVWYASVVIPEGNLTEFTYVDTIKDAVDEKGNTQKDTHYAIASELDAELKKNVHLNSNEGNLDNCVDFEIIYKDADGKVVKATDSTTHVKSFEIKVKPKEGQTITNAQRLSIDSYSTILDTSNQTAGESWKFSNTGKKDDLENNSTHSYSKPKPVVKQGGVKSEYGDMTYKSGTVSADLEETNGILYYRVLINTDLTDNEAINLKDIMPEGAEYVDGSLKAAFYINDSYSYSNFVIYDSKFETEDPSGWDGTKYTYDLTVNKKPTVTVEDGQMHITIPKGYNYNLNSGNSTGHTIQLTYQMKVSDDSSWNDPTQTQKTYENKVTWGNNSDSQKMEMTRELSEVQKKGAQIYTEDGKPTGKVKYNVLINPASKDLDNKSDTLTLKDKLTLPSGASATLSLDETKLYYLNLSNKDNNYRGDAVDSSLYRIAYDDINNEISVIVPDEFACVLEYTYVVDEGNIAGDYQISNSATLNGQFSDSVKTNIKNLSSSATVEKGKMKIYKVDDKDYNKRLTGAEFKLWKFNTTNNQWEDITSQVAYDKTSIKTNDNGEIVFQGDANNQLLEMATIYKLTETKAPEGYDLSKDPYYFVLVQKDQNTTIEQTKANMTSTFTTANVDINKTHFFNNNEEVYMYITNHTSNVNVRKVWVDSNNKPTTNGSNDIKVQLYKTTKKKETCTVNLHLKGYNSVSKAITVSKNKPFTIQFYHNGGNLNLPKDKVTVTKEGENYGSINCTYDYRNILTVTTNTITEDCDIDIEDTTGRFYFEFTTFELIFDEPDVSTTKTKVGDAVTLNEATNWSYTWSGNELKAGVTDGEDYYYTVEEVGVPSGYQVSYTNNDGIQEGDITVTNKKLDNYDLPDTGGFGTFGYYAIGALFITATLFAYIANIKKKGAFN